MGWGLFFREKTVAVAIQLVEVVRRTVEFPARNLSVAVAIQTVDKSRRATETRRPLPRSSFALPRFDFRTGLASLDVAAADHTNQIVDGNHVPLRAAAVGKP